MFCFLQNWLLFNKFRNYQGLCNPINSDTKCLENTFRKIVLPFYFRPSDLKINRLPKTDDSHATLINNWIDINTRQRWIIFTIWLDFIVWISFYKTDHFDNIGECTIWSLIEPIVGFWDRNKKAAQYLNQTTNILRLFKYKYVQFFHQKIVGNFF